MRRWWVVMSMRIQAWVWAAALAPAPLLAQPPAAPAPVGVVQLQASAPAPAPAATPSAHQLPSQPAQSQPARGSTDPPGSADPPRTLALDLSAPAAHWLPQVLPPGARLLHGPLTLPFGAHASGQWLAWRTAEGGYAMAYLTPDADNPLRQRWLWLREPRESDFGFDLQVHAVLSMGPALSRDIVVLETFSRPAPAGGARQSGSSVYRRVGDGVQPVPAFSALLGAEPAVTDAASARARLAPAYLRLLPTVPGRLAALFASLPWPLVELSALERLQRLLPGHPAHETYDSANGFLEIRGDAGLPGYQAALFRHAEGGWLLAVQKRWPDSQRTWFLRQAAVAGDAAVGWADVSAAVMPGYDPALDYALPRRGVQVRVPALRVPAPGKAPAPSAATGPAAAPALPWSWDGRRFVPATTLAPR